MPRHYEKHDEFTLPSFAELFENDHPVHVEYCSGNGLWICEQAEKYPEVNWIGVEKDFERVRKIYSKKVNSSLDNLFVVSGFGEPFAQYYLPKESVDVCYINFPDPWPKDRHAKHRIVKQPFMHHLMDTLKVDAPLHLVTDDATYASQMREVMQEITHVAHLEADEFFPENHEYGQSWFEKLWRSKGLDIIHLQYKRVPALCSSK